MHPGEIISAHEPIRLNPGRDRVRLTVVNSADRSVQVGSHFHFAEVNAGLQFDRAVAWGYRLDVAAGTSVRFEPNVAREIDLVPIAGRRVVPGLGPKRAGAIDEGDPEPTGPERGDR